jgi:5'-deoxynucleotidase YfbR-like HD superfamily hydrolase
MTDITTAFERGKSDVLRWAIVRTIRDQTLTDHCHWVALFTERLLERAGITDAATVLAAVKYALRHDDDELVTSDLPTPFKSRLNGAHHEALREFGLTPERPSDLIKAVVKVADNLDAALFLAEEVGLGNGRVVDVLNVILRKLDASANAFQARYRAGHCVKEAPDGLAGHLKSLVRAVQHSKVDPLEG